jgi:hypothetical protein
MSRILLLSVFVVAILAANALAQNVVVPAGTEIFVSNKSVINTSALKMGDDLNFKLTKAIVIGEITIPKGTDVLGRVVEVEKFNAKAGKSHVVIMFDFLKVGDDFYCMQAVIESTAEAVKGVTFSKSTKFEGGTLVLMKGEGVEIAKGTAFNVKISEDVIDA